MIAALEEYPVTLQELVPEYLSKGVLEAPECEWDRYPLEYERSEAGYELTFRYVGPGMNLCTYRSETSQWACRGYF